ncbi:MAG: DUF3857 domain-containing protein [Bacteroidia bacterium]|nr:DUF3857 domain-containing protein [Bacteroidia bacterium]
MTLIMFPGKFSFFILFLLQIYSVQAQSYDAELIYQETRVSVNSGMLQKNRLYEIKINNRGGERFCKVAIPYSRLSPVSEIEAFIQNAQGAVVARLKKSEITDRSAVSDISFYEDDFIKEFTLKHNQYPYTLVYSYREVQKEFMFLDYWIPVLAENVPTQKAVLQVTVPRSYKIAYNHRFTDNFVSDTLDTQIQYTWKASCKNPVKSEIFSPKPYLFFPTVVVVPRDFHFDMPGSTASWTDFGNWQYDLIQGLSDLPQNEKNTLSALVKDTEDEKEKIRALYHYLQDNTRYINVTIETGGLKPYPASYVAQNKYGDCKALTNYFKSVLEFAGIPSFYTKVYAGAPLVEIEKELPSQQFNHIILCVPLKQDTVWLDCTSDGGFNYLGTFTQNRDVFLIDKDNSRFVRTPALGKNDVREIRKVTFAPDIENGGAKAAFSNTYKGNTYESLLYISRFVSEPRRSQLIVKNFTEKGFEMTDFTLAQPLRDATEISFSYTASSTQICKVYGNDVIFNLLPFSVPAFEKPENRKLPVQLDYPIYKVDTLEYSLPEGYTLSGNLQNQKIEGDYGEYNLEFYSGEEKIRVIKSLWLYSGTYPTDGYKSFYHFLSRINEIENGSRIVLTKHK